MKAPKSRHPLAESRLEESWGQVLFIARALANPTLPSGPPHPRSVPSRRLTLDLTA
jgi:hypothetical protein